MKDHPLFVLYASYVEQEFKTIPKRETFYCRIHSLPIAPGRYQVVAHITVKGEESDWLRDGIGYVDVEAGDSYGTGKIELNGECSFLVSGDWLAKESY